MARKEKIGGEALRSLEPRCKADEDRLRLLESGRPAEDVWLDVRALEMYLRRSRRAVYHLIEAGRLPCERVGRRILVRKADADRVMGCPEEDWRKPALVPSEGLMAGQGSFKV